MAIWNEFPQSNLTDYVTMFSYVNTQSGDFFGTAILIGAFAISMLSTGKIDIGGIVISGFITFALGILLSIMGMVNPLIVQAIGVATFVGTLVMLIPKRE